MSLSRQNVGIYKETRSQSSQLAEPLWTDPGLKTGISVCELISTLKKAQTRNKLSNNLKKILKREEKATATTILIRCKTLLDCEAEVCLFLL